MQVLPAKRIQILPRYFNSRNLFTRFPGEGVLPYMGYKGMRGPKGYDFSAVLV